MKPKLTILFFFMAHSIINILHYISAHHYVLKLMCPHLFSDDV